MPLYTQQSKGFPAYLWGSKPSASDNPGKSIRITDIGGGIVFISDGAKWVPQQSPYTYYLTSVVVGIPSSGSIADNGALTLNTGINNPSGILLKCFLHFPANAIYAGSAAGLYYVQMSNTTTGVIYNNTYVSGGGYPESPTPFVTTGPGAYTQATATDINLYSVIIKGGLLLPGGTISPTVYGSIPSNANNKTTKFKYGGTSVSSVSADTGSYSFTRGVNIYYTNSASAQITTSMLTTTAPAQSSINSAADQLLQVAAQISNAADYYILRNFRVSIT